MRFETLRETLLKGGAAPRHVRRYIAELEDHLDDLAARQRAEGHDAAHALVRARALLGDDRELSAAMLEEPCFRALSFRAPWLVFGLLPPLACVTASLVPVVLLYLLSFAVSAPMPDWYRHVAHGIGVASDVMTVPLVAAAFVAIAMRQRMALWWPLLSTATALLLFAQIAVDLSLAREQIVISLMPLLDAAARAEITGQLPLLLTAWGAGLCWLRAARRGTSSFA